MGLARVEVADPQIHRSLGQRLHGVEARFPSPRTKRVSPWLQSRPHHGESRGGGASIGHGQLHVVVGVFACRLAAVIDLRGRAQPMPEAPAASVSATEAGAVDQRRASHCSRHWMRRLNAACETLRNSAARVKLRTSAKGHEVLNPAGLHSSSFRCFANYAHVLYHGRHHTKPACATQSVLRILCVQSWRDLREWHWTPRAARNARTSTHRKDSAMDAAQRRSRQREFIVRFTAEHLPACLQRQSLRHLRRHRPRILDFTSGGCAPPSATTIRYRPGRAEPAKDYHHMFSGMIRSWPGSHETMAGTGCPGPGANPSSSIPAPGATGGAAHDQDVYAGLRDSGSGRLLALA